jgi:hydroxymethylglutaryl-CoA reductase (NADPH)
VASVNRGCKATRQAGGISTLVENVGATRAPVFKVKNLKEAKKLVEWCEKHFNQLKKVVEKGDPYLCLLEIQPKILGRNVYLRFVFDTNEAMGMNMATLATGQAVQLIKAKTGTSGVSLTGNLCIDKKPAWQNFIKGRGKKVWAEAKIKKEIVKKVLKTTPEKIVEVVYRKCLLGSAVAGSIGFNGHYANIVAALFLGTGQDLAHVVEGSLGITTAEIVGRNNLYFSIYLPDLMIGTVGGGTHLATQKEALSILGLGKGKKGEALKLAEIIAGAVLAGELSLIAALASGGLVKAHERLGRGKNDKS